MTKRRRRPWWTAVVLLFAAILMAAEANKTRKTGDRRTIIDEIKYDVLVVVEQKYNIDTNLDANDIGQQFIQFKKAFGIHTKSQIIFRYANDLAMLIDYLEQKNQQTSVFYILSSSIYENNNNNNTGNYIIANNTISKIINNNNNNNYNDYSKISKKLIINNNNINNNKHDICGVADELSIAYNKTIYIWPCPKMKQTIKVLPSLETVSFAVKSVAEGFNWTEAVIFADDDSWGLPLAIAANLHVPYRIEIGTDHLTTVNIEDDQHKVIIICTTINSITTKRIIEHYDQRLKRTKILMIDVVGSIFHSTGRGHDFIHNLSGNDIGNINGTLGRRENLLVLSILTDKFKQFMNRSFHEEFEQFYGATTITPTLLKRRKRTHSGVSSRSIIFSEFFGAFDFIVSILGVTENDDPLAEQFDFIVLDYRGENSTKAAIAWRPFLILQQNQIHRHVFTTHPVLPGYIHWATILKKVTHSNLFFLGHCGVLCYGLIGIAIAILICIVGGSIAIGIAVRNYLLKKRLSKGPNKIVLSPNEFVFPVDTRRVDEGIEAMLCCWLQQLQEFGGPEVDKPDILKGSIGSLKNLGLPTAAKNTSGSGSLARHNTAIDMRARYNGDLVQLKEIPIASSTELKSKAMDLLIISHGMRHENLNPLIGWLPGERTALVYDYCSRGSLQDVLIMDEIKLDWSFRLSLLTDLVRGMRYLHSSPIRVHGSLTSRNCIVDARWVLKITDYGLPAFYEAQGLIQPTKTAKELLWTAPEAVRCTKGYPKCGTQSADVYSFGIIMQEVVVRGEPYCMLSLSPEEIITKIKRPPPLIRPSVSKGAAPPEAINIMRQCWAEAPEMRPDFNTVYERFKQLNHGRKVNFVDTMFQMLEKYSNNLEELIRERTDQLEIERKKTEQLLNRMLPSSVAEKLKMGLAVDPEEFSDVTIYFSDIVGFTTIAAHCSPVQVVDLLNDLYTCFDATINAYNVYKIETIGDAYMVVSGLPVRTPDHAEQIATMALDLLHQSGRFQVKHLPGVPLQLRIGLHTGPCCAGVVGLTMPRYCLFGDTVNTASRMESTGSSWRIHLSEATRILLYKAGGYNIESRGPIEIKGKGLMTTYWLLGKKGFDKPLPTPPPIGESHGLDDSLIRNSIILKAQSNNINKDNNNVASVSSVPNSSMPIVAGSMANTTATATSSIGTGSTDTFEVKVEITPPMNEISFPNSISLDSSTSMAGLGINISEHAKTANPSPQSNMQRKLSEFSQDGLLNPANFNRLNPTNTGGGSASRLFKRIEEMMDLSSPYNHYRCLSPSESNLSQFAEGRMMQQFGLIAGLASSVTASKPGSSRLLRRQFSLDKDDGANQKQSTTIEMTDTKAQNAVTEIKMAQLAPRMHKQNSASMAQDLEKIEEIPMSPTSSTMEGPPSGNESLNIETIPDGLIQTTEFNQTISTAIVHNTDNHSNSNNSTEGNTTMTTSAATATTNNNNNTNNSNREISLNVESLLMR